MKSVYSWDGNGLYIPSANKVVPDDYQLQGNETFDDTKDANGHGLRMPIKRVNGRWVGATEEEFQAAHPATPQAPDDTTRALMGLSQQVMELSKKVDELRGGAK